jgi:hypothetical protein
VREQSRLALKRPVSGAALGVGLAGAAARAEQRSACKWRTLSSLLGLIQTRICYTFTSSYNVFVYSA